MNKSDPLFGEKRVGELAFALLMSVVTFCLVWNAWDADSVNGSVYHPLGLLIMCVVFFAYLALLESQVEGIDEAMHLNYFSVGLLSAEIVTLLAFSWYIQQKLMVTELFQVGSCGLICLGACDMYMHWRLKDRKQMEYLKTNNPGEYIRVRIERKKVLTEEQQLLIFTLPDVEQLLYKYMQYDELIGKAEIKLIDQPYAANLLKHLPRYSFTNKGDAYMLRCKNAPELVLLYVKNGNAFNGENELKMFDLPNAAEVVEIYISFHYLSDAAEVRLFELPNAQELVEYYADTYDFNMGDKATQMAEERGWI